MQIFYCIQDYILLHRVYTWHKKNLLLWQLPTVRNAQNATLACFFISYVKAVILSYTVKNISSNCLLWFLLLMSCQDTQFGKKRHCVAVFDKHE